MAIEPAAAPDPRSRREVVSNSRRGAAGSGDDAPNARPWWRRPLRRAAAAIAPPLLASAVRVLAWTLRWRVIDEGGLRARWARGEHVIVAFWHDRLLMMPLLARDVPICIMVSQHRDGEMATRALARWGVGAVRGSATRGAIGGFLRMVDAYRRGQSLAVIPDGPRGPRHVAKAGVVRLAKATGAPIYPISYAASRAVRLGSWDRLLIPLPFARVAIVVGEPLVVPRRAEREQLEEGRRSLEARLAALTRDARDRLAA